MARKSKETRAPAAQKPADGGLPSRAQILEYLSSAQGKAGKREIARAFGVRAGARIALKRLLAEMAEDGTLAGGKKDLREKGKMAAVAALEVTGRDRDGDLIAKPLQWDDADGPRPPVRLLPAESQLDGEIGIGDRVLAKMKKLARGEGYEATPFKKLPREKRRLLGIYRVSKRGGGTIEPIDRKELKSWAIAPGDEGEAKDGDLVRFDLIRRGRFATPRAEVLECLGNPSDQRQISLIAIHAHGIPVHDLGAGVRRRGRPGGAARGLITIRSPVRRMAGRRRRGVTLLMHLGPHPGRGRSAGRDSTSSGAPSPAPPQSAPTIPRSRPGPPARWAAGRAPSSRAAREYSLRLGEGSLGDRDHPERHHHHPAQVRGPVLDAAARAQVARRTARHPGASGMRKADLMSAISARQVGASGTTAPAARQVPRGQAARGAPRATGPREPTPRRERRARRPRTAPSAGPPERGEARVGPRRPRPRRPSERGDRQRDRASPQNDRQQGTGEQNDRQQNDRQQGAAGDRPQNDRQQGDQNQGNQNQGGQNQGNQGGDQGNQNQGDFDDDDRGAAAVGAAGVATATATGSTATARATGRPPEPQRATAARAASRARSRSAEDDVLLPVAGILDIMDSYAFVRTSGYLPGHNDVYVSLAMVKRFGLRKGDAVTGTVRQPREGEKAQKFNPLVKVETVNGADPEESRNRIEFSKLTPLYPQERLRLETTPDNLVTRVIDLVAPIGKGQRGLIVSPPEGGQDDGAAGDRQRDRGRTTPRSTSWSCSSTSGPRRSPTCSAR